MLELPIFAHREEIVNAARENSVVIVVGETGSGKTTLLPRFLYESGIGEGGVIGITEPRRIAATSVARFVAEEMGSELGKVVGYQVRFDDRTDGETPIKFMTDGILLREFQVDPDLRKYSVIMVDEAHERSCNIDFILGLLKNLLKRRDDLTVVVSSATIDAEKFSQYFGGAPVIEVSGRMYPVDIVWADRDYSEETIACAISEKILNIHRTEAEGDVLVFMTGAKDIGEVVELLKQSVVSNLMILPVHAGLSPEDQQKIFHSFPGKRKVVVATNIAETSITIDGIVYVIDSGFVKQKHFHPESGIESLDVVHHSQAGCNQRTGRAGRTGPGFCFRMYTEKNFNRRPLFTEPEIRRISLAGVVLLMESIGIENVADFDFIDPPDSEAFHEAYETLIALGAIKPGEKGLTDMGREMARLPLDPKIARMVLEAKKHGCVKNIATIAAFFSVRSVFPRPKDKEYEADRAHTQFKNPKSDALTFLNAWKAYEESEFDRDWCFKNFLHSKSLWEAKNIREQLLSILERSGVEITESEDKNVVMKSVAAGLAYNLFRHGSRHAYSGVMRDLQEIFIHPGSSVFGFGSPTWMVASEIVETTKRFARTVSSVEAAWLPELAPSRFRYGLQRIVSCFEGDPIASVQQEILYRYNDYRGEEQETKVGIRESDVSVAEARKIQENCIAEAQKNSWVPLVFRPGHFSMEAVCDGVRYQLETLPAVNPLVRKVYYCKIRTSSFGGDMVADPQFPLFSFLGAEDEERKAFAAYEFRGEMKTSSISETPKIVYPQKPKEEKPAEKKNVVFTPVKAREFQCVGCGVVAHVTRKQFQGYSRLGQVLTLTCSGCGMTALVTK
ncbi:MAG: ATP-dependent RNA helicase [Parcubacteria group bacterium]|nr:ATP-dependent RNA helicase [Parcubacteria group bacterium]